MEENKPQETDSEETSSETLDEILAESEENTTEGDGDVQDAKGDFITREDLESVAGRKFESKEEFAKHYKNLASYVGKKVEPKVERAKPDKSNAELIEKITKIEFLSDHPEAKSFYDEYIRPMANGQGVTLKEAYEKVKPLIDASESQKKEKEIGVESNNRIQSADFQKTKKLSSEARTGSKPAQDAYMKEVVLKKFGF